MGNEEKKERVNVTFDQTKGDNISITIDSKQKNGKEQNPVNKTFERTEIPAFSLNGSVVFPHALQPLVIQDKNTVKMLEKVADGDRRVAFFPGLTDEKDADVKISPSIAIKTSTAILKEQLISRVGVLGRIVKSVKSPDGHLHILLRGIDRAVFLDSSRKTSDGIFLAEVGVNPA